MEKSRDEIAETAFALAKKYEFENGNCAQSVFAAVIESLGLKSDDVFRAASGFADGVGLTGEGHCGTLSGAVLAISYLFGRKREEFGRRGKMMKSLMLSRQMQDWFADRYGTCRCKELQTKFFGRSFNLLEPADQEAALNAGVPERCSDLAGEVAGVAVGLILDQQERDAAKASGYK